MNGRCMCGAVTFKAEPKENTVGACHCEMCRRWSGLALMTVSMGEDEIRFGGGEHIRRVRSSDWAERAWCDKCGTNLFYRVTVEGPHHGIHAVCLGLFDEPEKFEFNSEIFIDRKPGNFEFAGTRKTMTEAEVMAMYGMSGDGADDQGAETND